LLTSLIKFVGDTNSKVYRVSSDITSLKEGQERQDRILESLASVIKEMIKSRYIINSFYSSKDFLMYDFGML
jgi:hypothetical protein